MDDVVAFILVRWPVGRRGQGQASVHLDQKQHRRQFHPKQSTISVAGAMKAGAQASSELVGLMTRQTQAVMKFAAEAAKCRAPQELIGLQMKYWQTAIEQQTEATRRIAAAWNIALPQMQAATLGAAMPPVRDRITLSETGSSAATVAVPSQPGRSNQGDRRSAA